ncbi:MULTISPECIES: response regulator [Zhongshania]|jgi:twitching motility two-component system response regulator PilH|uniref:Response regulator n=1 Tax=Zhongshania aquimaris TaxID=2857107 RepID=A0ABS6VSI1_9GAMM|nr:MULTISPECIES: response regulator [Zhongshania]MBQ0797514.1 response regulator [Zhongshania sp.]MBW2941277.1 response regulator [Zhongshania aquimaris]|tara:strand:- start:1121 stop:1483 length:363 start_codon:yes stop_codon:yes gene_type:complete
MPRVLIIDDSPTEIFKISEILSKNGYEVLTAESGELGLNIAKEQMPDVVLMDIVMPGLNGFQATRQLSRDPDTSGIPVIIVTTKDQETDRLWGQRQGAKGYLTKPVDSKGLLNAIDAVLN